MKTKVLLTLPILLLGFFLASSAVTALTDPADSTKSAYFWGGTTDGNVAPVSHAYQGAGAFDASGVTVPSADGDVTGHAWGGHGYGWLSFENADVSNCVADLGLPAETDCSSRKSGSTLAGFARILSIKNAGVNSGGWHGYVKLDGVSINSNALTGYAWSPELGYIQFAGAVAPAPSLMIKIGNCTNSEVSSVTLTLASPLSGDLLACDGANAVVSGVTWTLPTSIANIESGSQPDFKKLRATTVGSADLKAEKTGYTPDTVPVNVSDPCVRNGCEATICTDETCWNGCENKSGTKVCNPGGFKEVAP